MEKLETENIINHILFKCRIWFLRIIAIVFLTIIILNRFVQDSPFNEITSTSSFALLALLTITYILFYTVIMKKEVIASFMSSVSLILFYLTLEIALQTMPNFKNLFIAMILLSLGSFAISLSLSMYKFLSEVKRENKYLFSLEIVGAVFILFLIGALFLKGLKEPLLMIL